MQVNFSVYLNVFWEKNFPIVLLKEKEGYVLFEVESYSKVLRQQKTCFFFCLIAEIHLSGGNPLAILQRNRGGQRERIVYFRTQY